MSAESIFVGLRVPVELHKRVLAVQADAKKATGIEPKMADVMRMLLERGLDAAPKRRPSP